MNERDSWTVDAMEKWGGDFVKHLGALARRADYGNLRKIKAVWPEYWLDYESMGRKLEKDSEPEHS